MLGELPDRIDHLVPKRIEGQSQDSGYTLNVWRIVDNFKDEEGIILDFETARQLYDGERKGEEGFLSRALIAADFLKSEQLTQYSDTLELGILTETLGDLKTKKRTSNGYDIFSQVKIFGRNFESSDLLAIESASLKTELIRLRRAEVLLDDTVEARVGERITDQALLFLDNYIHDEYSHPSTVALNKKAKKFKDNWQDKTSVREFYNLLYSHDTPFIGSFLPYEIPVWMFDIKDNLKNPQPSLLNNLIARSLLRSDILIKQNLHIPATEFKIDCEEEEMVILKNINDIQEQMKLEYSELVSFDLTESNLIQNTQVYEQKRTNYAKNDKNIVSMFRKLSPKTRLNILKSDFFVGTILPKDTAELIDNLTGIKVNSDTINLAFNLRIHNSYQRFNASAIQTRAHDFFEGGLSERYPDFETMVSSIFKGPDLLKPLRETWKTQK